jgi:hypothetical protein
MATSVLQIQKRTTGTKRNACKKKIEAIISIRSKSSRKLESLYVGAGTRERNYDDIYLAVCCTLKRRPVQWHSL